MNCPTREMLLAWVDGAGDVPHSVVEHIATCASCMDSAERLRSALAGLASGMKTLASSTPASLETRLRWRLHASVGQASATTLRERPRGIREWLRGHRMALRSPSEAARSHAGPAPPRPRAAPS